MIRLFATDYDSTFAFRGRIVGENRKAVSALEKNGVAFCLCSGRMPENVHRIADRASLPAHIVACNGAFIQPYGEEVLARHPLSFDALLNLAEYCEAHRIPYSVYNEDTAFYSANIVRSPIVRQLLRLIGNVRGIQTQILVDPVSKMMRHGWLPYKVNLLPSKKTRRALQTFLAGVSGITVTTAGWRHLEVMDGMINKWTGLHELAAHLGIADAEVAAIGDQDNDVPMVRFAGEGFAVENAIDRVKQVARWIVAPARYGGVAEAIYMVLENREHPENGKRSDADTEMEE